MKQNKSYTEMLKLNSLEERFNYLKTRSKVGDETFGGNRYLNQNFYKSSEWLDVRQQVILRDNGCELGLEDYPIKGKIYVHHINELSKDTLLKNPDVALDMENLVCVSKAMHDAIHYGYELPYDYKPITRTENDTIPWR